MYPLYIVDKTNSIAHLGRDYLISYSSVKSSCKIPTLFKTPIEIRESSTMPGQSLPPRPPECRDIDLAAMAVSAVLHDSNIDHVFHGDYALGWFGNLIGHDVWDQTSNPLNGLDPNPDRSFKCLSTARFVNTKISSRVLVVFGPILIEKSITKGVVACLLRFNSKISRISLRIFKIWHLYA